MIENRTRKSAIGVSVNSVQHSSNALIKSYVVERPSALKGISSVEGVIEVAWKFRRTARDVWAHFKDFNGWQNRYGYHYDGIVGDEEGYVVHLSHERDRLGGSVPYLVRKVVPERLIYLESQPFPFGDKGGAWSGHNVMALSEQNGETLLTVFMEHTWLSQEETAAELHQIVRGAVDAAVEFWREFFIPDLEALLAKGGARSTGRSS